jgi:predicted Zn-dependent protease
MSKTLLIFFFVFSISVKTNAEVVKPQKKQNFRIRLNNSITENDTKLLENEIVFGRGIASKLLGKYELLKDKKINNYIGKIGTGIAAQFGRKQVKYFFGILVTEEINAFAASGGYIFITTGTLKILENEAQLAGVLAHEISHDKRKHIVENLNLNDISSEQNIYSAFNILKGAVRTALERLNLIAFQILTEQGLPENDEYEADIDTIQTLQKIGYNPHSYVKFLNNTLLISKRNFSSTHPSTELRIQKLNEFLVSKKISKDKGKLNTDRFGFYVEI